MCSETKEAYAIVLILAVPVSCSLRGPLFHSSPVVVFLDRGHPCFWNFNSTIPTG